MRMHIEFDEDLLRRLDEMAGPRGRSAYVRAAVEAALERDRRRAAFEAAAGTIPDHGHEWDDHPAAWVRDQRRGDPRRLG